MPWHSAAHIPGEVADRKLACSGRRREILKQLDGHKNAEISAPHERVPANIFREFFPLDQFDRKMLASIGAGIGKILALSVTCGPKLEANLGPHVWAKSLVGSVT